VTKHGVFEFVQDLDEFRAGDIVEPMQTIYIIQDPKGRVWLVEADKLREFEH
jgi:hypothetical protein